ncbi:hypothetical protein NEAUS03_0621 [Nematocida ausubeli]|nr:hypothetical protein NEAUS03_0621 [Nematocida ausubeli]
MVDKPKKETLSQRRYRIIIAILYGLTVGGMFSIAWWLDSLPEPLETQDAKNKDICIYVEKSESPKDDDKMGKMEDASTYTSDVEKTALGM